MTPSSFRAFTFLSPSFTYYTFICWIINNELLKMKSVRITSKNNPTKTTLSSLDNQLFHPGRYPSTMNNTRPILKHAHNVTLCHDSMLWCISIVIILNLVGCWKHGLAILLSNLGQFSWSPKGKFSTYLGDGGRSTYTLLLPDSISNTVKTPPKQLYTFYWYTILLTTLSPPILSPTTPSWLMVSLLLLSRIDLAQK